MAAKSLVKYIIIFNVLMALLLALSSQYILLTLKDKVVTDTGIFIFSEFPQEYIIGSTGTHIPTAVNYPIPNYPLIMFILVLIGNGIFMLLLRRTSRDK